MDAESSLIKLQAQIRLRERAEQRQRIVSGWIERFEISDPNNCELDMQKGILRVKEEKVEPEEPDGGKNDPELGGSE